MKGLHCVSRHKNILQKETTPINSRAQLRHVNKIFASLISQLAFNNSLHIVITKNKAIKYLKFHETDGTASFTVHF